MTTREDLFEGRDAIRWQDMKEQVDVLTQAVVLLSYNLRETNKQLETLRGEHSAFKAEVLTRGILASSP